MQAIILTRTRSGIPLYLDKCNRFVKDKSKAYRFSSRTEAEDIIAFASGDASRLRYEIETVGDED